MRAVLGSRHNEWAFFIFAEGRTPAPLFMLELNKFLPLLDS
jgi:hypothetical protein